MRPAEIDPSLLEHRRRAERERWIQRLGSGLAVRLRIDPAADSLVFLLGQGEARDNQEALRHWIDVRLEAVADTASPSVIDELERELRHLLIEFQ